jgi:hypothetical protein
MSKLADADWLGYRALLEKYGRDPRDFRLHDEHVRRSAHGGLEGYLWIIHSPTGRGMVYELRGAQPDWLSALENDLRREAFPAN